jgi:hypothetical protein
VTDHGEGAASPAPYEPFGFARTNAHKKSVLARATSHDAIPNVRKPTDDVSRIDSRLNGQGRVWFLPRPRHFSGIDITKMPQKKTAGMPGRFVAKRR